MAITTQTSQQTSNTTSATVTMPASVASGDMLIALAAMDSGASAVSAWSNSFTELLDSVVQSVMLAAAAYKIAAGGEANTVATHTTERSNHIGVRIPAAEWANDGTAPVISTIATNAGSTAPNATGVTFGWSATHQTIFITVAFWDDSAASTVSAYPSGYTDNQVTNITASSAGRIAMAVKPASAASSPEDAGAFTLSASEQWGAVTIAVKGPAISNDATGTGAIAAPAPTLSGSGTLSIPGTGAIAAPAPTLSGSGTVANPVSGTGAIAAPAPTLAGSGGETFTGTGAIAAPAPTLAGTGGETFTGTGAIAAPAPMLAGEGTHTVDNNATGTGAIAAPAPTLAGSGAVIITGTGAWATVAPSLSGTGAEAMTGAGALAAPAPTLAGTGAESIPGSGGAAAGAPTLSGSGTVLIPVTGSGGVEFSFSFSGSGDGGTDPAHSRIRRRLALHERRRKVSPEHSHLV